MNIDFEELHIFNNRLSKYVPREMYEKAYRAWKQAAKKWYSIAINLSKRLTEQAKLNVNLNDTADKRLELLKRAHLQLMLHAPRQTSLIEDIEKELGDAMGG